MAIKPVLIEALAQWCLKTESQADARAKARSDFFGYDDPGEIKYLPGTEDLVSRERRFMGYWAYYYQLPDGRHPAELAVEELLSGEEYTGALKAIQGARFMLAVVTMAVPGKTLFLELQDEEFEVPDSYLSQQFSREEALCTYLLPAGRKKWIMGPGWVTWPTRLGPGVRKVLKQMQMNPLQLERFFQQRSDGKNEPQVDIPRDITLQAAVDRMSEAARAAGKPQLVRTLQEWRAIVLKAMQSGDSDAYFNELAKLTGDDQSLDEINKWLGLASNIWNNVPQPDRGNKSAVQLRKEMEEGNR
jgi:hypothetical protein